MLIPVFAEAIGFPSLTTVAMAVGTVVAFYKRGIDRMTDRRLRQGFLQSLFGAQLQPRLDLDYPSLATRLVDGGLEQIRGRNRSRVAGTTRLAGADHFLLDPIGGQDLGSISAITRRPVGRTPQPSARCSSTDTA